MPGYNPDFWTTTAAVGEAVTGFVSDTYWIASLLDLLSGADQSVFGLSTSGLTVGVIIAAFSAGGSAYSHAALNTYHQKQAETVDGDLEEGGQYQLLAEQGADVSRDEESPALSWWQYFALGGCGVSHAGYTAGTVTFVFDLATNQAAPYWSRLLVEGVSTLLGAGISVANVRACREAMEEELKSPQVKEDAAARMPGVSY